MDSETRRFSGAEPARLDEAAIPQAQQPPVGAPTTYLPPVMAAQPNVKDSDATAALPATNLPASANQQPRPMGYMVPPASPTKRNTAALAVPTQGANVGAIILLALGAFLLTRQDSHIFGSAIPMVIGLVFLYVYQQKGNYGFLVPGCILTGLGGGIVLSQLMNGDGSAVPLGLGVGFLALWAIHRAEWWWLIPGGILTLVGLDAVMDEGFPFSPGVILPGVLILGGICLLLQRRQLNP